MLVAKRAALAVACSAILIVVIILANANNHASTKEISVGKKPNGIVLKQ